MEAGWRPMGRGDLPGVVALAEAAHALHPERPEVFAERLALAPRWCFVHEADGRLAGYLLAHPWRADAPPALDALIGRLPDPPDALHLHDVVLAPEARGRGAASRILAAIEAQARAAGLSIALVAIAGKEGLWRAKGFVAQDRAGARAALATYGPGALHMAKPLAAAPRIAPAGPEI